MRLDGGLNVNVKKMFGSVVVIDEIVVSTSEGNTFFAGTDGTSSSCTSGVVNAEFSYCAVQ